MKSGRFFLKCVMTVVITGLLASCEDNPRAVMLPLQYADGSSVTNRRGEPVMAGYQTYGSAMHANATALYEQAPSAACVTCARLGAVVSEPSDLRQFTGILGATTVGAGAVMGGVGVMDYGIAAGEGKLGNNITQSNSGSGNTSLSNSNQNSTQNSSYKRNYDQNWYSQDGGYKDNGYARQGWGGAGYN